jgi:hypothetical protein
MYDAAFGYKRTALSLITKAKAFVEQDRAHTHLFDFDTLTVRVCMDKQIFKCEN